MEGGEGEDGRQADEAVEEEAEERGAALQEEGLAGVRCIQVSLDKRLYEGLR
jgi:hypothetical protein